MPALAIILTVICSAVLLVWSSRHFMVSREQRRGFLLTEDYDGPPRDAPPISVVVAAKDEADNIEACVRSILRQDYPRFELIVADDRSSDGTAGIVQRVAREDPRLRLIRIEELPEGWCGKNHAMQTAIASARADWICMIDADCRQRSTRTLSVAMQYARDRQADLLSVLPKLEMKGFWENVVQPVCGGVMMIWFHPERVNDPARRNAYANGAFMLMNRSAYEAVGTHAAVKGEVNEDMHMAWRVKQAGLRLCVVRCGGLYDVRMYTSLREIIRGWSRIFYGTFGTLRRLSISLAVLVVMGLVPLAAAALGLALAAPGTPPVSLWWACGTVAAAAVLVQFSVIFRFYRLIGARAGLAWTYPLGCAVTALALAKSLLKLRRGARVVWRGTSYSR
jgi:chlorobactene glucosyltransferase